METYFCWHQSWGPFQFLAILQSARKCRDFKSQDDKLQKREDLKLRNCDLANFLHLKTGYFNF
jgi:hypothetical protein